MADCCTENNTCWACYQWEADALQELYRQVAAGAEPYAAAADLGIPADTVPAVLPISLGNPWQPPDVPQPPIIPMDTASGVPGIAQVQPPIQNVSATGIAGALDWFRQSTTLFGHAIPNWGFVAAGVGAMFLMGGKKGKR